jgi:hypothetical protein
MLRFSKTLYQIEAHAKEIIDQASINPNSTWFMQIETNKVWHVKLQSSISLSIFIRIARNLYQNDQQSKIYKNIYMNCEIMKLEKLTSWRAVPCFARFKAPDDPNQFQNACDDVWWRKGSLRTCRSRLIINFHLWVLSFKCLVLARIQQTNTWFTL